MKGSNQISSDNLTFYRVVAMTMVVLYHCYQEVTSFLTDY